MSMPYCPEAINALCHAAARNIRAAEIQASLGWDGQMLARVCRTHQIDIVGAIPPAPPIESEVARIPDHPLHAFATQTPGCAGLMLVAMTRHPVGAVVGSADMGLGGNKPTAVKNRTNKHLQRAELPWVIQGVRGGAHSGFCLVRTDGDGWAP